MRVCLAVALLVFTGTTSVSAQAPQVQEILEKYEAARPTDESLAFYTLDWAPSLKEAKIRAGKEGRPILFIWLTNITAATSFFTGHC